MRINQKILDECFPPSVVEKLQSRTISYCWENEYPSPNSTINKNDDYDLPFFWSEEETEKLKKHDVTKQFQEDIMIRDIKKEISEAEKRASKIIDFNSFLIGFISFLVMLFVFVFIVNKIAHSAEELDRELAVKCILGESRGENYDGMLAVAGALRNRYDQRGDLNGVDGCFDRYFSTEQQSKVSVQIRDLAKKAWNESLTNDLSNGADHWHADYITPWWAKYGIKTARVGRHIFYKEVYR